VILRILFFIYRSCDYCCKDNLFTGSAVYWTWNCISCFFFLWRCGPTRAMTSSYTRFLDHTQRRTTVGRTPLDEWSARRRDLYLTAHNTHNRRKSMPPVGFESTISASEGPQTYALDRAATGTGNYISCSSLNVSHRSVTEILYFSHMCISHYIPVSPSCVTNFFFFS